MPDTKAEWPGGDTVQNRLRRAADGDVGAPLAPLLRFAAGEIDRLHNEIRFLCRGDEIDHKREEREME